MSFLKRLGQVIANIAGIASGIGPIFGTVVPKSATVVTTVISDLQQVAGVIATVEAIGQAATTPMPGAEKLRVATPLVAQVIMQSSLLAGKHIADPVKYQQGAQKVADGIADILNSINENSVQVIKPEDVK